MIEAFQARRTQGDAVQELEVLLRAALFKPAAALLGWLLQCAADRIDADYPSKPGWRRMGRKPLNVRGIFGDFTLRRDYYYHSGKREGHFPADAALGLEGGLTPALARLVCLEAADEPSFRKAQDHLSQTGGIEVGDRQIQRLLQRLGPAAQQWQAREVAPAECAPCEASVLYVSADGTGAPMRKEELRDRKGKSEGSPPKTRQAYLGCVFTQHRLDDQGQPLRDHDSTTYVSSFESIDTFGPMLRREALRRGMGSAPQVVLLIDGAEGLRHMGGKCFADAIQIVDFYHAIEHAGLVLQTLLGSKQHPDYPKRLHRWARDLLADKVHLLIRRTRKEALRLNLAEDLEKTLAYFQNNISRMQYATFRAKGFFIGSGVIEAGCKTIIGSRCKQSGMFWSIPGATHVLAFRCIHASHRANSFWKHRHNLLASLNDSLPFSSHPSP